MPESVTTLKTKAFKDCSTLSHIVLLSTITNIETDTFENCNNLKHVRFDKTSYAVENLNNIYWGLPVECEISCLNGILTLTTPTTAVLTLYPSEHT